MTLNGEHVAHRCAGHSCSDRNRCAWHVAPVPEGLAVVWVPHYDDRRDNVCRHYLPERATTEEK